MNGSNTMKNRIDDRKKVSSASTNPLPKANTPPADNRSSTNRAFGWAILPLRLFLGVTFVYGGVQKLTDPQYFNPSTPGYIGKQIAAFATGSPLHSFLINLALPHATLFGAIVAYGELAIGTGVLLGMLLRPAAVFGLLLNILFFFSATWRVHPYFYGSDIVFVFCWITLLLAGPTNSGLPSLDALLVPRFLQLVPPERRVQLATALSLLIGVGETPTPNAAVQNASRQAPPARRNTYKGQQAALLRSQQSRRNFIWGVVTGGAAMLVVAWLGETLHLLPQASSTTAPAPGTTNAGSTPSASGTPAAPGVIATINDVPTNSATTFTIPSNGDPGVLIHLSNGQFVAYDATCTHAGCPVDYDPSTQHLVCPCHGAEFDPAKSAAVIGGPANTPLTSVLIKVDNASGTITLSN